MIPYTVRQVTRNEVKDFIEEHHYSHSINGLRVSHCFGLYDHDTLVGAMIYGGLAMANAWKKYGDSDAEVLELRRLVLIDDTPKNSESFFHWPHPEMVKETHSGKNHCELRRSQLWALWSHLQSN